MRRRVGAVGPPLAGVFGRRGERAVHAEQLQATQLGEADAVGRGQGHVEHAEARVRVAAAHGDVADDDTRHAARDAHLLATHRHEQRPGDVRRQQPDAAAERHVEHAARAARSAANADGSRSCPSATSLPVTGRRRCTASAVRKSTNRAWSVPGDALLRGRAPRREIAGVGDRGAAAGDRARVRRARARRRCRPARSARAHRVAAGGS
ncbi:MAG: hypothetical protein U1E73_12340 [Planctomycetota bacterium]